MIEKLFSLAVQGNLWCVGGEDGEIWGLGVMERMCVCGGEGVWGGEAGTSWYSYSIAWRVDAQRCWIQGRF